MMVTNLVGIVLSLPILVLTWIVIRAASLPAALLVVVVAVLPNPVLAGIQFVSFELTQGRSVFTSDQWNGLRRYGPPAVKVWLLSLAGTAVIVANIDYYLRATFSFARLLEIIWIYVLIVWVAVHLYVYPLIIEPMMKRTLAIYRAAFVMAIGRPLFTGVTTLIWLLILLLSAGSGLIAVFGLALAVAIQQCATAALLPAPMAGERDHTGRV